MPDIASKKTIITKSVTFVPTSTDLPPKVLLIGQHSGGSEISEGEIRQVFSKNSIGQTYGFGSQLHRMALRLSSQDALPFDAYVLPLAEPTGAVAAVGAITFTGPAAASGALAVYIGGERLQLAIFKAMTAEEIRDALITAVTQKTDLPVSAAAGTDGAVTITAKWSGVTGNDISLNVNIRQSDAALPAGVGVTLTAMTEGAGEADLTSALQTARDDSTWLTHIVSPYSSVQAKDAAQSVIGRPNGATGQYSSQNYKPSVFFCCDTSSDAASLITEGNARREDAAVAIFSAPNFYEVPFEISALIVGKIAASAKSNAASHYEGTELSALELPSSSAFTTTYQTRSSLLEAGISSVFVENSTPILGDCATTYHPQTDAFPAFRYVVDAFKVWCVANDVKTLTASRNGLVLVQDASLATNQALATDPSVELSQISPLAKAWEQKGWIFSSSFTLKNSTCEIDPDNPDGLIRTIRVILSGNVRVFSNIGELTKDSSVVTLTLAA